jgi:hypothetical protein
MLRSLHVIDNMLGTINFTSQHSIQPNYTNSPHPNRPTITLLWKQPQEPIIHQTPILLRKCTRIPRPRPVKQPAKRILSHIVRLHLYRLRGIVRDKPAIPTDTIRRPDSLVYMLRCARPRQVTILKCAFLARLAGKCVSDTLRAGETAPIRWNAKHNFVRGHALSRHVGYRGVAGDGGFGAVWDLWGEELGLVAAFAGPRTGVVVCH